MELISVQRARSIWLFDTYDLNPRGKDIGSDLLDWLKDAYQFSKVPANQNDLDETKALYFAGGNFQVREEIFISVELRVYTDGLVADTRSSTEDTDLFLSDILESVGKEFSLPYKPEIVRKKLYVSELTVKTDAKLAVLNPKLAKFAESLFAAIGTKSPVELTSIGFWPDMVPNPSAPTFRFERKWGAEFSENRYYSRAPLQTEKHRQILDELEIALC
jgi:hypothetical protein